MYRNQSRREWLAGAGRMGVVCAASVAGVRAWAAEDEEDVAPPEDLMREHGVLRRVLLIYDEAGRRILASQQVPADAVRNAADVIRTFIEAYHEKLEEDHLFPRFEKAGRLADLTKVLRQQHQAGRRLTEQIAQVVASGRAGERESTRALRDAMASFTRMYRPHAAREDSVLFPALRSVMSKQEFESMGDAFEKKEQELFGQGGFEKMVDRVASIEKSLNLYDLAQFTPR
jgi:hemerythrin-like domain-containing protein